MGFALTILFIIFGGGYYIVRFLIESGQNDAFKSMVNKNEENKNNFEDIVFSRDLDQELLVLYHDEPQSVRYIVEKIAKNEKWYYLLEHDYMLNGIVLHASRGKLGLFDARNGISCNCIKIADSSKYIEGHEARALFILWVADQLKKHGISTRVFVKSFDNKYRVLSHNNLFDTSDREYIWEQILPCNIKKESINDTYN